MTAQRVINLEKETEEVKASVKECDVEISQRFKEKEDLTSRGARPDQKDWTEHSENDLDFQEEFDSTWSTTRACQRLTTNSHQTCLMLLAQAWNWLFQEMGMDLSAPE